MKQGQEGTGQPAAEALKVAAAAVADDVFGHRAAAVSVEARTGESSESSAPDGNAVARFLQRERGDSAVKPGHAGVEQGVATGVPARPVSKMVAAPAMTDAPAKQVAAEVGVPPETLEAQGPSTPEPRRSPGEQELSLSEVLLKAQRDPAGASQTITGGGESFGSGRRQLAGESARAAFEVLAAQARAPRTAPASPGAASVPAPVLDGLEARFQAWLAQAAGSSPVLAPQTPDAPDVPGQVVKAIQMQWRDGIGEARIQLRPDHLGAVTVSLRVEHGTVVATVRAESPAALEIIRARQQELQAALEAQGLRVNELEVTLDPEDRRERPAHREPDPPRPPRRRESDARFEVVA